MFLSQAFAPRRALAALIPLVLLSASPHVANAQPDPEDGRPLWEIGIGAFGALTPDYPASDESSLNGLPAPIIIYRGDFFRLGEDAAVRLVPLDTPRFELGISADAAFGVESDNNDTRDGLPDLDPLLEIGPELIVRGPRFRSLDGAPAELDLALQGRSVFSLDLDFDDFDYRGLVFEPEIRYRQASVFGTKASLRLSAASIFATEELHDYFYEVDQPFATPSRAAFEADGGYLGSELSLGVTYPIDQRWRAFAGGQMGVYTGAENDDSPLFRQEVTGSAFLGFTYAFFQSEARAPRR